MNTEPGKTAGRFGKLVPNPKAKLQDQFHEVCRFKYFSGRTEESYWQWVVRFLKFHRAKAESGKQKVEMNIQLSTFNVQLPTGNRRRGDGERSTFNTEVCRAGFVCPHSFVKVHCLEGAAIGSAGQSAESLV